ncbi:MAG TPA: hypothetical protein VF486_00005 [Actinomycetes bacterium]
MVVSRSAGPARSKWPAGLAWALLALVVLGLAYGFWLDHLLRRAGRPELGLPAAAAPMLLAMVSAAAVGMVLAGRRPEHPVGWLLLGLALSLACEGVLSEYVYYGVVVRPGVLPGAAYLAGLSNSGLTFAWLSCAGFVLLLTPTGSLPSPRWRWWARVVVAATVTVLLSSAMDPRPLEPEFPDVVNPIAMPPALTGPLTVVGAAGAAIVLASLVVAAWSLVLRFRRARGVERQQLRWLAVGAALAALALLAAVAAATQSKDEVVLAVAGCSAAVLPLATGAAVLRYRLYDLDRLVSRTLAYGLLTVLLAAAYAATVVLPAQLFGGVGGEPAWVVAAATLAVAALFQPARRRVQELVDRRFDRRRYDAERTIAAFSAWLRQHVDLDTLTAELLAVVERTMQPSSVSLWLRRSRAASRSR